MGTKNEWNVFMSWTSLSYKLVFEKIVFLEKHIKIAAYTGKYVQLPVEVNTDMKMVTCSSDVETVWYLVFSNSYTDYHHFLFQESKRVVSTPKQKLSSSSFNPGACIVVFEHTVFNLIHSWIWAYESY